MATLFFHNPTTKTLKAVPEQPNVTPTKDGGHKISVHVEGFCYSTNKDVSYSARDQYMSRDSRETAIGYFKTFNYPKASGGFEMIEASEFFRLEDEYEEEIRS